MVSKMKKALIYTGSFIAAWMVIFIAAALFLGAIMLFISFITWSWPIASPFEWFVFRLIAAIATIFAISWSFSKENKKFVNETLEGE